MNTQLLLYLFLIILAAVFADDYAGWTTAPVDPSDNDECCNESIFRFHDDDELAKNCSEKFGIPTSFNETNKFDFEDYVCFLDCIFTEGKIMMNNSIDMDSVKEDITGLAVNSTELGEIMIESMAECSRLSNHIWTMLRKNPDNMHLFRSKCSPMAVIISDCASMEYYINCPDKYWSPTVECETMKYHAMEHRFTRL